MDISSLNIGILHSIIGKNDGVSIVIDQTVKAMVEYLRIPLGNIFFLAAHAPSRFNTHLNEIFWHKSDAAKYILKHFSGQPPEGFEQFIAEHAIRAKTVIEEFVNAHNIDLLIAHNVSHPYNLIAAAGLGLFLQERRNNGIILPRCLVWWHDSYFEREKFSNPNGVTEKFLKYLPGTDTDGIVFINSEQVELGRKYYKSCGREDADRFFKRKTAVIPNTCDIEWDWKSRTYTDTKPVYPPQDDYNRTFFRDIGLIDALEEKGYTLDNTVILLQHTRIVPRKRIDTAIDFAFMMSKKFMAEHNDTCIVLLVSGHSGDEQEAYRQHLDDYFRKKCAETGKKNVVLLFGEHIIYPSREIIVDRKFYKFSDIPSIVASAGGMGTYFSEVEGYGNNLLEMISMALPAVINRYEIYKTDIEPCGFRLPSTDNCELTEELVDECYRLLTDYAERNAGVRHNLDILEQKMSHREIQGKLEKLIKNIFTYA